MIPINRNSITHLSLELADHAVEDRVNGILRGAPFTVFRFRQVVPTILRKMVNNIQRFHLPYTLYGLIKNKYVPVPNKLIR